MNEKTTIIEQPDRKLSVLLRVLAARTASRKERRKARLKAYSHHILNTAYLMDFITTDEYRAYAQTIEMFGFLFVSPKDSNLLIFRGIAGGL